MKLLYFLLITLYVLPAFSQDDNMLPYLRLKGNIESVRIIPYNINEKEDKTIEKNISDGLLYDKNTFIKFNKSGKVIEKIDYNHKNEVTRHRKLFYDNKNRCINEKIYNEKGEMTQEISITYDDKKKESRETDHRRTTICQLDERSNPVNCMTFTTEGELTKDDYVDFVDNMKVIYFYKDDKLPYQQSMSANGTLPAYSELSYQYDKKGNWIRKEVRYKDKLVFLVEAQINYFN